MTDIIAFLVVLIAVNSLNALQVPFTGLDLARRAPAICRLDPDRGPSRNIESLPGLGRTFPNSHEVDEQQRVETMSTRLGTCVWIQGAAELDSVFDVNLVVNNFNKALSIRPLTSRITAYLTPYKVTGGINGYMEDTASLISMDDLMRLYEDKIEHAKVFRDLVHEVVLNKYLTFYMFIFSNKNFLEMGQQVVDAGFNIEIFQALSPVFLIISIAV